jgi:penicillin amidase
VKRRSLASGETLYGLFRLALRLGLASVARRPRRQTVEQRIATLPVQGLPVEAPVELLWDEHLVPYIAALSDRDLAVALGLVHAHLRLAQMELLRRIAQGRLAEVLGPVAISVDHTLRLLDPGKAVPAIVDALSNQTREWLEGFVAGINHYLMAVPEPPHEFRLLDITAAPWTIEHILEVGRLLAADVNWLVWRRLSGLPRGPDWPQIWNRLLTAGMPDAGPTGDGSAAPLLLGGVIRSASNAVAVGGHHSATGSAWLAGDPHLPLTVPSIWLAAAYCSPSYKVAGLMMPGIPVVVIGRNPWIAWSGTNLPAASSELFDVSELPASAINERRVKLAVRWSRDRELVLRDTLYGPIVSDAPLVAADRAAALRWIGHEPSDELSALLAVNRTRNWEQFRHACAEFAVPGQTLVYADRDGHVGRLMAAWLPVRPPTAPAGLLSPLSTAAAWNTRITSLELPAEFDPPRGFIVSANEPPPQARVAIGWFFSPDDRASRLAELLDRAKPLRLEDLKALLQDVRAGRALALRDRLLSLLAADRDSPRLSSVLASWDGRYAAESAGALAFELVLNRLTAAVVPPGLRATYGSVWTARQLIADELTALTPGVLAERVRRALREAEPDFRRWRSWGSVHRLRLAHPLAMVPGLSRRYRFLDWPWAGSNDTIMKSGHGLVQGVHRSGYGSNARYIFDLSDPDANHLVVLGGQDGAPSSAAFFDQAELLRDGATIRVPLRLETARISCPHQIRIVPPRC